MTARTRGSFWKIDLARHVSWGEVIAFTLVTIVANCAVQYQALLLPLILNEQIGVAVSHQGKISGGLATVQQIATLALLPVAGHFSDTIGRRKVLLVTMAGFALCFFAYPLASTVFLLFLVRIAFGAFQSGHTAAGATRIVADYPAEHSRGKFISLMLVIQWSAVALFVGAIGARVPEWLIAGGLSARAAGQVAFVLVGVLAFAGFAFGKVTLSTNRAIDSQDQASADPAAGGGWRGRLAKWHEIALHARANPRFLFVLAIGLVIRTDTSVVGAFLSLWVINAAGAQGISPASATLTAGALLSILSVAQFVTPPVFGLLADRVNRSLLLLFGVFLTGFAFTSTLLVENVMGWAIYGVVSLIGLAEGAQTIAAQSMFGQEVPSHLRGSAMGLFAAMGTATSLLVTVIGGYMFDEVGYASPFVLTGLLHFVCFALAAAMLVFKGRAMLAVPGDAVPASVSS